MTNTEQGMTKDEGSGVPRKRGGHDMQ